MLLASIRERQREIHLLRVIGAPPSFLFFLIQLEALVITLCGVMLGSTLLAASLVLTQEYLVSTFGLHIGIEIFTASSLYLIAAIIGASIVVAMIPSFTGYKNARSSRE